MEKFWGWGDFLKNPSKLKNFWVKGGGQIPQSPPLATRLSGEIGGSAPFTGKFFNILRLLSFQKFLATPLE